MSRDNAATINTSAPTQEQHYPIIKTFSVGNHLGEGVFWDAASQMLWWTDILGAKLYRYSPESEQLDSFDMPEPVGSFACTHADNTLLCAFKSGMGLFDLNTQQIAWMARPQAHLLHTRMNDGKTDPKGRFWVGSMGTGEHTRQNLGELFSLNAEGECQSWLKDLGISNGLCWSPCGHWLYHTDTLTRAIYRYAFDAETGALSASSGEKTLFAKLDEGLSPDGATVDAMGNLYVAVWDGARIDCYSPEGELLHRIPLPVTRPTCVAFAGPYLDWLVVTSAREGLSDAELAQQPLAGHCFIMQAPQSGLAQPRFHYLKEQ